MRAVVCIAVASISAEITVITPEEGGVVVVCSCFLVGVDFEDIGSVVDGERVGPVQHPAD